MERRIGFIEALVKSLDPRTSKWPMEGYNMDDYSQHSKLLVFEISTPVMIQFSFQSPPYACQSSYQSPVTFSYQPLMTSSYQPTTMPSSYQPSLTSSYQPTMPFGHLVTSLWWTELL